MILVFEPDSGVSGDMFVGSLIDLGAETILLHEAVKKLHLPVDIKVEKVDKCGILATRFSVIDSNGEDIESSQDSEHRNLSNIIDIIENSQLEKDLVEDAISVFTLLAEAEAKVHETDINSVHFHEVGALDAIVDIICGVMCINLLKPQAIYSTPVNVGSGTVKCAHGILSVPAPATAELLKKAPTYFDEIKTELATPTGAALLVYYVSKFIEKPASKALKIGLGAGKKELPKPNVLKSAFYESV